MPASCRSRSASRQHNASERRNDLGPRQKYRRYQRAIALPALTADLCGTARTLGWTIGGCRVTSPDYRPHGVDCLQPQVRPQPSVNSWSRKSTTSEVTTLQARPGLLPARLGLRISCCVANRRKSKRTRNHVYCFKYDYPGNIRELQNLIERGVVYADDGGQVDVVHLFSGSELLPPFTVSLSREGRLDQAPLAAAHAGDDIARSRRSSAGPIGRRSNGRAAMCRQRPASSG